MTVAERTRAGRFAGRSLVGLAVVSAGGVVFALLALLVRVHFGPMFHLDQDVAVGLNHAVAGHPLVVKILDTITQLGARTQLIAFVLVAVVGLLIRRQPRLAVYLVVTGVGGSPRSRVEDARRPAPPDRARPGRARRRQQLPERARPRLVRGVRRAAAWCSCRRSAALAAGPIALAALLVVAVGFTRIVLGVHFVSDVLAGWLLGVAWLGMTAYAFRLWRREAGQPVPQLQEGLEPEARHELRPDRPRPTTRCSRGALVALLMVGLVLVSPRCSASACSSQDATAPTSLGDIRSRAGSPSTGRRR